MILDRREAQLLADRQTRLLLVGMGADIDVPDVSDAKVGFDSWLDAPMPGAHLESPEDDDRAALLEALGVRHAS